MKNLLKDFASGGRPWNPADPTLRLVMAVNLFTGVGIIILTLFAVLHYLVGVPVLSLILLTVAVAAAGNLVWLRHSANGVLASSVALTCLGVALLAALVHGGIDHSGPYWLGIFPAVAFLFKGTRGGLLWTAGLMMLVLALVGLQLLGYQATPFSTLSLALLITAMLTLSTLLYVYEMLHSSAETTIQRQSRELIGINARLIEEARERMAAEQALRRSDAQLRYLAHHDRLTDLPNRHSLTERLEALMDVDMRSGRRGAIMFIDLDGFKAINDRLGHVVGDELLRLAARRLRHLIRSSDFVARYGGDEFVLVLPGMREQSALDRTARRLINELSAPFKVQGHRCLIGASIGVARFPDHGTDLDTVMKHADKAMYRAKNAGGNRWEFHGDAQGRTVNRYGPGK